MGTFHLIEIFCPCDLKEVIGHFIYLRCLDGNRLVSGRSANTGHAICQQLLFLRLNIEHFRRRLEDSLDDGHRRLVSRLLAEEVAKLPTLSTYAAERNLSLLLDLLASRAMALLTGCGPTVS